MVGKSTLQTGAQSEPRMSREEAYDRYLHLSLRQRAMVAALYNYRVVTNPQLGDMFSTAESRKDRGIIAGRNMQVVVESGLAVKDTGPIPGERHKTARYHLTRSGLYVCLKELGVKNPGPVGISKMKKIMKSTRARHYSSIIDVAVSLSRMKDLEVGEICGWTNDGDVDYVFSSRGSRHRLMPDARGVWLAADGTRHPFYVEVERTIKNREYSLQKVKKYIYFSVDDRFVIHEARYEFPPVLWVVACDREYDLVRDILLAGALVAHYDIPTAAHYMTFGLARLSDVKDYERGALAGIWESVYDGMHGLTFRELSDLAASKKRAYRL